MAKCIAVTFDFDMINYFDGKIIADELTQFHSETCEIFKEFDDIKSTCFIRIDSQIESLLGRSDYVFRTNPTQITWLKENGHQIGWHHHAYNFVDNNWTQETNEDLICKDIEHYGQIARSLGLTAVRMGWGWQTNKSLSLLHDLGFEIDSSAIPRPTYAWEKSGKDWSRTTNSRYYPSKHDYQTSKEPLLGILEIPISTTYIPCPGDDGEVLRYLNWAYHPEIFKNAVAQLDDLSLLVSITHPYEFLSVSNSHPLLAFNLQSLRENLSLLKDLGYNFKTLSEVS